jgi:rod shape-determining protein MreC
MYQLFRLIHRYRAFLLFLFIEFLCIWLLVGNNPYHSAVYFHTSNSIVGNVYETRTGITQYLNLPSINKELARSNARLLETISRSRLPIVVESRVDSMLLSKPEYDYHYLAARVVNNSTRFSHNFLTINKGRQNGVEKGMGVVSADGIVGKVMSVSDHFATVSSLLNTDVYVSAMIRRTGDFGSIHWDGKDIISSKLMYIPSHTSVQAGDTIVTSGYNSLFPQGLTIGYIDAYSLPNDSFYDIDVLLSNRFSNLAFVYVIRNAKKDERTALEHQLTRQSE